MDSLIKICGLSTPETLDVALGAGADMVGFVRFPKSPRHVSLDLGHRLSLQARGRAQRVVLLVDPGDEDGLCRAVEAAGAIDPAECRKEAALRFTPARMAQRYLELYDEVLARSA